MEGNSGRRTRSGRKVSATTSTTPSRTTRRSNKKQTEDEINEQTAPDIIYELPESPIQNNSQEEEEGEEEEQSDVIKEMLLEAAQGIITDQQQEIEEPTQIDDSEEEIVEEIIEEVVLNDDSDEEVQQTIVESENDLVEELPMDDNDDWADQAIALEEEEEEQLQQEEQDVEMYVVQDDEQMNADVIATDTALDEKSSSFPFGTVGQSETSEDAQNEEEAAEIVNETGAVESSLLASLAGDNANSLPSVGGGEESDNRRDDFGNKAHASESNESCDSDSNTDAIAEDLPNGANASDATIVTTEIISEDELPLPTKPEINDAEEVSDEELPAPQRAELPADAEVISEDELPVTNAIEKNLSTSTVNSDVENEISLATENVGESEHADAAVESNEKTKKSEAAKRKIEEEYNPMSPTSESNDATTPAEKKIKTETADAEQKEKRKDKDKDKEKEKERKRLPDLDKYWRAVKEDAADFTGWTYLLQYVDNETDAEAAREAYDAFLSHYPYCYGYWRKYADYEKRKGIKANCNKVFERGLEAIPLSVDLWIHYLSHVRSSNPDNEELIRAEFERAIDACGIEFRSDKLWDAYIKWENEAKRYLRVTAIYDRLLAIPTQGYSSHFDNFQDLINQHSITSTVSSDEIKKLRIELRESAHARSSSSTSSSRSRSKSRRSSSKDKEKEKDKGKGRDKEKEKEKERERERRDKKSRSKSPAQKESSEAETAKEDENMEKEKDSENEKEKEKETEKENEKEEEKDKENEKENEKEKEKEKEKVDLADLSTLTDEEISSIKDKVISLRRKVHKNTVAAVTARWTFEEGIKRPYFHVKPLERCQLKNWSNYLDFEIEKGDRKRILVLFERCLIACALYEDFWFKMILYLEAQSSPDVALISNAYRRACEIHHPDKASFHLTWAFFEENHENFDRAAEIYLNLEKKIPNMLQISYRRISLERRRGNLSKCRELFEHYIANAKNKTLASCLAVKYARFLNKICNDFDEAMRVLRQSQEKDPGNARLALQTIDLALQRPKVNVEEIVHIMDQFMARDIDPEQKLLFAQRKMEFLEDFGGTGKELEDSLLALQTAMAKAKEYKKKRDSSPSRKGMKDLAAASSAPAAYNGSNAAGYGYSSASSSYYAGQQQGGAYQQQQYDNYYNQWQYSSQYGNYSGQWSGYGNYNY